MHKLLFVVFALMFISGCASTVDQNSLSGAALRQKNMVACKIATQHADWSIIMMEVPTAGNAISNKMAAFATKLSGSNSVDALVGILSQSSRPTVAVFSDSDEMAAATLEAALHKLSPGTKHPQQPLCFIGDSQYGAQLYPAVERAGLPLLMVPKP